MKHTNKIITSAVVATSALIALTGAMFCPYAIRDDGACGTWSAWVPPGWCYSGECVHTLHCRTVEWYEGNGPYLYCAESNNAADCSATLEVWGPPDCTDPQPSETILCSPPTTTRLYLVTCPD